MSAIFLYSKQTDLEAEIDGILGDAISPLDVETLVPPAEDLSHGRAVAIIEWVKQRVDRESKDDIVKAGTTTQLALAAALRAARAEELGQGLVWHSPALAYLCDSLAKLEQFEAQQFPGEDPLPDDDDFFLETLEKIQTLED